MRNIKSCIDHTLEVFKRHGRHDIVIGLTPADWDELCALVIEDHVVRDTMPALTRDAYDGTPIRHLSSGGHSFVAHDFGSDAERRFPVEVMEPV
jgi:hypothetical protein